MATLLPKPRIAAAVVHDGPPKSPVPPDGATKEQKKRRVAGVGQLAAAIAIVVVVLAAAVLASDPLNGSLRRLHLSAAENCSSGAPGATVERFLEWFDSVGGVRHEHIDITTFPLMGRGSCRAIQTICSWLCRNTIGLLVLALTWGGFGCVGVVAVQEISEHDQLLFVPMDIIMYAHSRELN